ncbi:MAG: excinuclease ABC subunit UvrC [Myxococcales bacterium]|nr:excinuclease ABC subunit UvrC [Myxococcales bacterium]
MKDQQDSVIYVGKAKSLRARVSQYFQEGTSDYRAFIGLLSRILSDIETIVTRSEKEALLLEREMIRRHEPRFNIIWRDDKQYLCLRIDTQHQWPRVEVIRRIKKDGARYFGPYHSASAARQMLRVVNRHFQLRTCRDSVLYNRSRPCLEYQIGRCPAPCVLEVDQAAYKENVDDVLMFLEGKTEPLVQRLENRMWSAAKDEAYERAGHYRDQLSAVRKTMERQTVALTQLRDIEVIGLYREARDVALSVVEVRDGRVENVRTVLFETQAAEDQEIVSSFILQRAMEVSPSAWVPELFVPLELDDASVLSEIILDEMGSQVSIRRPQRGDGKKLLDLAQQNAEHGFHEQRLKTGALERTLEGLQSRLSLSRLPLKIECYDISNLGSHLIVGAQVTFERAAPAKKLYRKYRVRRTAGQDDFASMYEVLSRRFAKECSAGTMPDLVVIDGGKGQLEVARAVFRDLKVEQVDLISLAKSRVVAQDAEGSSVRSPERVFVPGRKEPIILPQSSPEVLLLARIRDEAHRFGITFHRELRRQTRLRSSLEDIPGVGEKRKKVLLRHFGSLKKIQEASVEELEAVQGLGHSAAVRIYEALQNSRTAPESLSESPEEAEDDESRIRATQKR